VALVSELDSGANYQAGVQVITLRYAVAEELVPILQQITSAMTEAAAQEGGPPPNRRANIASHRATNSLIISADPETQESIANVVRSLDVRRQQILVEAIIVEVSDTAARELGLQFFLADPTGNNGVPFLSSSYAGTAPNLLAITGALLTDGGDEPSAAVQELQRAAISSILGSSGLIGGIGGTRRDGTIMGAIVNALSEDIESNVLSTPSVLTLDNETANILVGQQIPITTGEALGDNLDNQFRTVRREDVGVQLQVRPQISEGGAIRLEITQEVSSIFGPVVADSTDLITNRRAIETVVQVDAGQVIVLGGLIQDDLQRTESGIPGLRHIPIAGRLFSSEGRTRRRTNLMVFLRPTIVNTPEQAAAATQMQYRALINQGGLNREFGRRLEEDLRATETPAASSPSPTPLQTSPSPPPPPPPAALVTPP
jgi:general secretion pathway protein D